MLNSYLILLDLVPEVYQLLLVNKDELQVLSCDVIIILFHLSKCILVVLHQVIDVLVLSLLNFMDFNFSSQFKLFFKGYQFMLVLLDKL